MCQQQIRTFSGNLKGSLSAISAIEPIMTSARRPMSAQRSSMLRSSAKESIRHMAALGLHIHASTKNSEVSPSLLSYICLYDIADRASFALRLITLTSSSALPNF